MLELILEDIRTNRISSTEISDALGKAGVLPKLRPLNRGKYVAAKVFYVYTWGQSNWALHEQIQRAPRGSVVFVDSFDCDSRAVLGDLVAKQLFIYQKIEGLVVNGNIRDAHRLIKEDYPIWSLGATPLGCHNKEVSLDKETSIKIKQRSELFANSILVADDSGCTLIESNRLNTELTHCLTHIELQEDIWYYCLDTLKMSTFEIICEKKYLCNPDLLPPSLISKLKLLKGADDE